MRDAWDDYWAALGRADRHAALAVVQGLQDAGVDPVRVIDNLIVPAQERIGELWLDGSWTIAQEHAATAVNGALVSWLGSFTQTRAGSPLVLVACVAGERHGLPALLVAEALRLACYRVTYVGADPEPDDLVRYVMGLEPRAVLFSASLTSSLATQKPLLSHLRAIGIPVIVGGRAFDSEGRRAKALGATAYARDVDEVLRLLRELPARLEPGQTMPRGAPDEEAAWLVEYARELTPYVLRAIAHRHELDEGLPGWWRDLESHVDHVVSCLAAAVVTGDDTILTELRTWLSRLLTLRGGRVGLVDEVWELLEEPLLGHPLARQHLTATAGDVEGLADALG